MVAHVLQEGGWAFQDKMRQGLLSMALGHSCGREFDAHKSAGEEPHHSADEVGRLHKEQVLRTNGVEVLRIVVEVRPLRRIHKRFVVAHRSLIEVVPHNHHDVDYDMGKPCS